MRNRLALFALSFAALPAIAADGPKPCAELKAEIAAKIDARGVPRYTLEVVAPDAVGERKVVASCEGGNRRIVYLRLPAKAGDPAHALVTRAQ